MRAGHAAIERRAERVDVGPRALTGFAGVLLERRIAPADDRRQRPAPLAQGQPRGAEVEEDRRAVAADVDVLGLDVPVEKSGRVNLVQAIEDRVEDAVDLLFGQRAEPSEQIAEVLALDVLHDQIGGAVGRQIAIDPDDVRMVEANQRFGFAPEAVEAVFEVLAVGVADRSDGCRIGRARMATPAGRYSLIATARLSSVSTAR